MATYTKETSLFDNGKIANGINEAKGTANNYIAEVNNAGIFVHQTDAGYAGDDPTDLDAYGVHISDTVDIIEGGDSVASYGANTRVGKSNAGHVTVKPNTFEVWTGSESDNANKVASFGSTITLNASSDANDNGKVVIQPNRVQIGKMVLAYEAEGDPSDADRYVSRINPGTDGDGNAVPLAIGYVGQTTHEMQYRDLECRRLSTSSGVSVGTTLSVGGTTELMGSIRPAFPVTADPVNIGTTSYPFSSIYIVNSLYRMGDAPPANSSTYSACWHRTDNGNYQLCRPSSSIKYKKDVEDISDSYLDPHKLYDLRVVQFRYKKDDKDNPDNSKWNPTAINPGFIAEEVAQIYPVGGIINDKDEIDDWDHRTLIPPMLKLIQEQHDEIEKLKAEVSKLTQKG